MKKKNYLLKNEKDNKLNSRVGKTHTVVQFENIFNCSATGGLKMKVV